MGRDGIAEFFSRWPQGYVSTAQTAVLVGLTGPRSASSGDASKNRDSNAEFLPPVAGANM